MGRNKRPTKQEAREKTLATLSKKLTKAMADLTKRLNNISISVSGCRFTFLNGRLLSVINTEAADMKHDLADAEIVRDRKDSKRIPVKLDQL